MSVISNGEGVGILKEVPGLISSYFPDFSLKDSKPSVRRAQILSGYSLRSEAFNSYKPLALLLTRKIQEYKVITLRF
jgi:hypothetical protein